MRKIRQYIDFKVLISAILLIIVFVFFIVFKNHYSITMESMKEHIAAGILVSVMEIFLLFFIFHLFLNLDERKRNIKRYLEEIDDYRGWNETVASYRLLGNIKRLNRLGINYFYLSHCYLKGLDFTKINLVGIQCIGANLENAIFRGINLNIGDFEGAKLSYADFSGANLENALFHWSKCGGVNFRNTILKNVNFEYASLNGADFTKADFTDIRWISFEQLSTVKSLYGAINLNPEVELKLRNEFPDLFKKPAGLWEDTHGPPQN